MIVWLRCIKEIPHLIFLSKSQSACLSRLVWCTPHENLIFVVNSLLSTSRSHDISFRVKSFFPVLPCKTIFRHCELHVYWIKPNCQDSMTSFPKNQRIQIRETLLLIFRVGFGVIQLRSAINSNIVSSKVDSEIRNENYRLRIVPWFHER